MKFKVVVKSGLKVIAEIDGMEVPPLDETSKLQALLLEQYFERVTGLRCHLVQVK